MHFIPMIDPGFDTKWQDGPPDGIPGDAGRPMSVITSILHYPELVETSREIH